ncbi:bifunctional nicotinamidase/pyrazinamidase [Pikeienuella piscinae]|uniref:Nicotinamidase n=1 Tax=Pikeienuella piscinae TaxID=2748098 RepID=A0A7L5C241_9RHOB|nr:bifunctional nicotinamidase/pyrazinamidase [Pikeienuella piscinae]QIE56224.1 bifunctional nicotinamidase/pyrazinamidase [Pikeienuella piscinae]
MTGTALIVIDVQNDFCPGGALAVRDGDAVVSPINALSAQYPLRVLTQDWHPADHSSFADNHAGAAPFSTIEADYGPQVLWPAHCVQGTPGAAFHESLRTDADLIIRKGFRAAIDSYSAFFENDHETPTGLAGYLRERGVGALVLCGLATDFCVRFSAVDAAKLGFEATVVEDACRGIDLDGSLAAAWEEMREAGVRRATVAELL